MQYYRNFELSNLYGVSRSAVGKWVEAAGRGKLGLTLVDIDGKSYIANTAKNHDAIKAMVEDRKKYFNRISLKTVAPKPEFYETFSAGQIADIISNLQVHREIPRTYNYLDGGAARWDEYSKSLYREAPHGHAQVLDLNQAHLDYLVSGYKRVNVIEIGPGNALPTKGILTHLVDQGILARYRAIDISPQMLEIARANINEWFGGSVPFEGSVCDVSYERFTELLIDSYDEESLNVVLFVGGTLYNFRDPDEILRTIRNSMAPPDLLICTQKLDTVANRRFFDFNPELNDGALSPNHRLVFDLLSIDDSFYSVDLGFDEKKRKRFIRARFNVALSIEFKVGAGIRRVDFGKGDTVLLWQFWHQNISEIVDQFERNGFGVLQASKTRDHSYSMIVCDLKTESE